MSVPIPDGRFVAEALRRLDAGAPIIYLHANKDSSAAGVLLTAEHFARILIRVPDGDDITSLVMAHDHLEGKGGA